MKEFYYVVKETEYSNSVETIFDFDSLDYVAEECAEQYFSLSGSDCEWPMIFEIYHDDAFLGNFEVDIYQKPEFTASQID